MGKENFRLAKPADLNEIEKIYEQARQFMIRSGNPTQWVSGYPQRDLLEEDIQRGQLYVAEDDQAIYGVFMFALGEDETYGYIEDGCWLSDMPYGTIHRIASDGSGGILRTAVEFCKKLSNHIRIDTHHDNVVMHNAVAKLGFVRSGIIHLANGSPRIAYELNL